MTQEYLSVKEASIYSNKSTTTIRKWIKQGVITTLPRKSQKSKVYIYRESLMAHLHTSVEPTIEGTGQKTVQNWSETDALKHRVKELKETIDQLHVQLTQINQIVNMQQQLITQHSDNLIARENEYSRVMIEVSSLKSDNQRLQEENIALTTQINNFHTYWNLKWWQRIGSSHLLQSKDQS